MKLNRILIVSAIAALPFTALAQEQTTQTQTTTTTTNDGETKETKVVTVTGTVQAYDLGHSLTIVNPDGTEVTYLITDASQLPKTLAIGKTVTILPQDGSDKPTVKTVTMTKTTKTTTKKSKSY